MPIPIPLSHNAETESSNHQQPACNFRAARLSKALCHQLFENLAVFLPNSPQELSGKLGPKYCQRVGGVGCLKSVVSAVSARDGLRIRRHHFAGTGYSD
jgi:hypothetical protein